jgi:hypothetical protein
MVQLMDFLLGLAYFPLVQGVPYQDLLIAAIGAVT